MTTLRQVGYTRALFTLPPRSQGRRRNTWNVLYLDGVWRVCDLTLMLGAFGDEPWRESDEIAEVGYGRLVLEHNYQTDHHVQPDLVCRRLETVYNELVAGLKSSQNAEQAALL